MTVSRNGDNQYVLRISVSGDRSENDYLAETEFVRFLAENGAPVADVIPSIHGRLVECVEAERDGKAVYGTRDYGSLGRTKRWFPASGGEIRL